MLNNRGQSLILFIIILPVILIVLVLVIDIGRVMVLKQELDNINKIVLDYGIDYVNKIENNDSNINDNVNNLTDNDMELLGNDDVENEIRNIIMLNKDDIDMVNIKIDDDKIYINLEESVKGIFSKLIDISIFRVKSSYVGYIDGNNKRIERVSGDSNEYIFR